MGELLRFDPIARRLAHGQAQEQVRQLLASDDPGQAVQAIDPLRLYTLIRTVGRSDGLALLHLASGEQVQAVVDLRCWHGAELDLGRLEKWMGMLLSGPAESVMAALPHIDPELIGRLLREHVEIFFTYDEDDAEALLEVEGRVETTPDGFHTLVMPPDEATAGVIRRLLRRLYAVDADLARQTVTAARHELGSQLEDTAQQMQQGRLEQLGFAALDEAMDVYARVDVNAERSRAQAAIATAQAIDLRVDGPGQLPVPVEERLLSLTADDGTFVGRALRTAADREASLKWADCLLLQLGALTNRVLVADLKDPGSLDDLAGSFERAHAHLNIGLEYLTDRDEARAAQLVVSWPLKRIFQVAANLVASLAHQAKRLVDRGNLTLVEELRTSLCTDAESDLIAGLARPRPVRSDATGEVFFHLGEVEAAARQLAALAYRELWTVGYQGLDKQAMLGLVTGPPGAVAELDQVSFDGLLATRAALELTGEPEGWRLLTLDEVAELCSAHLTRRGCSAALADALASVASPPQSDRSPAAEQFGEHWATTVAAQLAEEYGGLSRSAFEQPTHLPRLLLFAAGGRS